MHEAVNEIDSLSPQGARVFRGWETGTLCAGLLAFGLLLPASADAEDAMSGPYISVGGGFVLQDQLKLSRQAPNEATNTAWIEFERGSAFSGRVGYRFNKLFRAELEFTRRRSDTDMIDDSYTGYPDVKDGPVSGELNSNTIMLNAYVDMQNRFMEDHGLTLSVGGGLGFVNYSFERDPTQLPDVNGGMVSFGRFTADDWVKAAQFRTSLSYRIFPKWSIGPEYTLMVAEGTDQIGRSFKVNEEFQGNVDVKSQTSHTFMLQIRYEMGDLFD